MLATLLLLLFAMPNAEAQRKTQSDTVKVYENLNLTASVACFMPFKEDVQNETKELIEDFIKNLNQVKEQIPNYQDYSISYAKNENLRVVEKVKDVSIFVAKDGKILDKITKIATLKGEKVTVHLYFEEISEILAKDYSNMLIEAMKTIKMGTLKKAFAPATNLKYSINEHRKLKNKEVGEKFKIRPFIVVNSSIGVYSNKPQYEYGAGFGIKAGKNLQDMYYVMYSRVNQFDTPSGLSQGVGILSFNYRPSKYYSMQLGLPLYGKEQPEFRRLNDYGVRLGFTVYPFKGISISPSFHFVNSDAEGGINHGISIGYGF